MILYYQRQRIAVNCSLKNESELINMILPKIVKSYNQNNHIMIAFQSNTYVIIFQSYDKVMLSIDDTGVYLNEDMNDYTKTTSKYLYKAVEDILNDYVFKGYYLSSNIPTLEYILTLKRSAILNHLSMYDRKISNIGNDAILTGF